jgi:ParB family transcriptional regulator, chromosome partitioning protein
MALDLSALDEDVTEVKEVVKEVSDGKALRAPLNMFVPDEVQLNRERDPEADDRDRADIKLRGVLQPIVVGPRLPDGRLPIRFGHRRWRLSGEADLPDAPYIFEVEGTVSDDYAQYAENARRKGPTPMDRAELIVKRKAKGDKNAYIAKQIGIDPSEVTHHIVLVEGPDYIRALYPANKCRTPKYLYELANLAKEFPTEIQEFCATSTDFSRNAIDELTARLKNKALGNTKENSPGTSEASSDASNKPAPSPLVDQENLGNTKENPSSNGENGGESSVVGGENKENDKGPWPFNAPKPAPSDDQNGSVNDDDAASAAGKVEASQIPSHNPAIEKDPAAPYLADPSKIKKPLLLGTHKDTSVMVMLYKRPTTPGLVFIKYEDGTGEEEVEFGKVKNLTLTESKV